MQIYISLYRKCVVQSITAILGPAVSSLKMWWLAQLAFGYYPVQFRQVLLLT
ncbi:hypothetical protein CLV32_1953 [Pedobacter duraquae]|uniref:Uncharacterized protein n=1 Tax=Pedobacter duraquae TaxID=425511 RepID=A0A4V3C3Q8_9SPHI|nr:hypothetical protein CLV32_1953 [Pedobacter duraquae]